MIREMIVPFLIGSIAVVMMFQANLYIALAKTLNLDNVPFTAVLQYILYMTPSFLIMTLPVGTALGTSLAMTRLVRESEVTAMRAAGTPVLRILAPLIWFGMAIALLNFYVGEDLTPRASEKARPLGWQIGALGFAPDVKTNVMIQLNRFTASFGTVLKKGDDLDVSRILLIEQPEQDMTSLTTADKATYSGGKWTLYNAYLRILKGQDLITAKPMGDVVINERIVASDIFNPPSGEELSIAQLQESIESAKKLGGDAKNLEVKLHVKFSVPASCLVFAFVAPLFALRFAKGGAFVGVLLSLGMVVLYYNAFVIATQILAKVDWIPAWGAAWTPNIMFALLGVLASRRLE